MNKNPAILYIIYLIINAISNIFTKHLSQQIQPMQILVFKAGIGVLILLYLYGIKPIFIDKKNFILVSTRNIFAILGNLFWIISLKYLPIHTAQSLAILNNFFIYIIGILIFKEKLEIKLLTCILIGFYGASFQLNYNDVSYNYLTWLPIASAMCFAICSTILKQTSELPTPSILLHLHLGMSLFALIASITYYNTWIALTIYDISILIILGLIFLTSQLILIQTYRLTSVIYIASYKFAKYPINIIFAFLAFGNLPNSQQLFGGVLISIAVALSSLLHKKAKSNKTEKLVNNMIKTNSY